MAINAGDIVWTVDADVSRFDSALGKVSKSSKAVGAAFTAIGATVTATVGASISHFSKVGDEVQKMAIRTGVSTEAISELGFAAEQSGASLDTIGKAFKNQADFIEDAKDGLSTSTDAMAKLGLSLDEFQNKTPEQVFMTLAQAIGSIEDPMQRAALANDVFKRSGQELLPLFASGADGLAAMRMEAQELGRSMSQEQANAAAQFNDNLNSLKSSLQGIGIQIANVVVPKLNELIPRVTEITTGIIEWVKANPELASTITMATAAIGAILTVVGPLLIMLPGLATAFSAVSAIVPVVGAVIAALTGPVGLIIAAIGVAVVLIVRNWEFLKQRTQSIFELIKLIVMNAIDFIMNPIETMIRIINNLINKIQELTGLNLGGILGFAQGGVVPGYAQGGQIQGLAGGGLSKMRMVKVGERGPELAALPVGTRVLSHADMMRAVQQGAGMASAGAGMGSGVAPVFNISINGEQDPDKLVAKLKGPFSRWMADEFRAARR